MAKTANRCRKYCHQTYDFSLDYLLEQGIIPEYPSLNKIDINGIKHPTYHGRSPLGRGKFCHVLAPGTYLTGLLFPIDLYQMLI